MKSDYSGSTTTIQYNNGINHRLHHHHSSDTDTSVIESTARCNAQANGMSMFDDPRLTHKVNLAAAFHDHISCTKLPSQICKVGGDINSLIGASLSNCSTLDTPNSLLFGAAAAAAAVSSSEDKIQIQRLKDMILMQLDLIQHQQEQLLKKDRQLQGLKHDREALCLRLEKMENRITFLTKKLLEVNSDNNSNASINNQLEATNDSIQSSDESEKMPVIMSDNSEVSNVLNQMYSSSNSASPSTSRTGVKKCGKPVDQSHLITSCTGSRGGEDDGTNQTQLIEVEISDSNGPIGIDYIMVEDVKSEEKVGTKPSGAKSPKKPCKRRRTSKSTDQQAPNSNSSTKADNEESCNGELPCEPIKRRRTMSKNGNRKCDQLTSEPVNNCKQMSTNFNVLETDEPYDLYNCRQEMNLPQRVASLPCDIPVKARQIEVPSWRINHIPHSTSSEVAENLEDEVYLRRHAKLEVDERRRKRWDIQRLREQKHNEKLRSGRYNHTTCLFDKAPSSPKKRSVIDLVSFFPDPKDVQFIEVSDKLPVMAFGLPIPSLPPKPFSIPWLKSSRQSKKSQT